MIPPMVRPLIPAIAVTPAIFIAPNRPTNEDQTKGAATIIKAAEKSIIPPSRRLRAICL